MQHTWMDSGSCTGDTEHDFFPYPSDKQEIKKTRQICSNCPVQKECFIYAWLFGIDDGIWGGRTPEERSTIASLFGLSRLASFDDLLNSEFPLLQPQNNSQNSYTAKAGPLPSRSSFVLRLPVQFHLRVENL